MRAVAAVIIRDDLSLRTDFYRGSDRFQANHAISMAHDCKKIVPNCEGRANFYATYRDTPIGVWNDPTNVLVDGHFMGKNMTYLTRHFRWHRVPCSKQDFLESPMSSRIELVASFVEQTVQWAQTELELSVQEIAQAIGADRKSIKRWRNGLGAPSPIHRRQLEQLNQIRYLIENSFRSSEARQRWLHTSSPHLKGKTPYATLTEGHIDEVFKILGTLATGAFR